ncbi:Mitochondrial Translation Optimization [Cichlidogyrus casuarinus]|uniref:Mitochondrial Translation Optimization n=1 Tax=Cichlidogyrus casuarinus TaxID=1844966 RepID=A0ABD2PPU9_9PLAT
MSSETKVAFVNGHNQLRAALVDGPVNDQPRATSMQQMVWDEGLAATAQKKADTCDFAHDNSADRIPVGGAGKPIYEWIGQNLELLGSSDSNFNISKAMDDWWAENLDYNFQTSSCTNGKMCGHYTQMAWASTTNLGCAHKICPETSDMPMPWALVVCNYAPGGNIVGVKPYQIP